jgi:hypothetical protein
VDRVVRDQGWEVRAVPELREGRARGVQCIRHGLRREVREDQDSGRGWARDRDLGRGQDLGSGRGWVAELRCRLRVKRRVRRVRGREDGGGRVTRRAKRVR